MTKDKLDIAALSPDDLARLLSQALRRPISEEQVREIAEAGKLISPIRLNCPVSHGERINESADLMRAKPTVHTDYGISENETINLMEFTAFLAEEVSFGNTH